MLTNLRILVVDDDRDSLELLELLLSMQNATVTTATSVKQACGVLRQSLPNIVISDLIMPEQTGYDLLQHLQAIEGHQAVRTVACSSLPLEEYQAQALAAGFDACLSKPFDFDALIDDLAVIAQFSVPKPVTLQTA